MKLFEVTNEIKTWIDKLDTDQQRAVLRHVTRCIEMAEEEAKAKYEAETSQRVVNSLFHTVAEACRPYPKTFMVSVDGTQYEQVVNSPYEEEKMYGAHSGGCAPDEQEPDVSFHQLK